MSELSTEIALLAPVPIQHLKSGHLVCQAEGRVAFGSMAFLVFKQLDDARKELPVRVLLYASKLPPAGPPKATWSAEYIRFVHSNNGAHPAGMKYRPPTTEFPPSDNEGHWALFWEVRALEPIPPEKQPRLSELSSARDGKRFSKLFVPEGPTLILPPLPGGAPAA